MRCFVAVELDTALRRQLLAVLRRLPRERGVRWCGEHQLHVTLKFLGDVADRDTPDICKAVAAAAERVEPFVITLGPLGCFPNTRNPRVLWCGIDDPDEGCARWLATADPLLSNLGLPPETRPLRPHITLGRSRGPDGSRIIQRVLADPPVPDAVTMSVEHVVLFESVLSPRGARYTPRLTAPLGGT